MTLEESVHREVKSFSVSSLVEKLSVAAVLGYLAVQITSYWVTDISIRRVQIELGKPAAVEYARDKWRKIYPHGETFVGNMLYAGRKNAVLEYLGHRKLDE